MPWKISVQGASKNVARAVVADATITTPVHDAGDSPPGEGVAEKEASMFEAVKAHLGSFIKSVPDPGHGLRFDVVASGTGTQLSTIQIIVRAAPGT